jgi:hypothetical protein
VDTNSSEDLLAKLKSETVKGVALGALSSAVGLWLCLGWGMPLKTAGYWLAGFLVVSLTSPATKPPPIAQTLWT